MSFFQNSDVEIHYLREGAGTPVILVHGYASNLQLNWKETGWFSFLLEMEFEAIALDCRGHGASAKLYEPNDYTNARMGSDVLALMDHLEIPVAHLIGYSMGAMILLDLAMAHSDRVQTLTLGGVGDLLFSGGRGDSEEIALGMEAAALEGVVHPTAKGFRAFADRQKGDLRALAACMRGRQRVFDPGELSRFERPVLVAAGERDEIIGDPARLANAFPNGRFLSIPRRDHMRAVADPVFKKGFHAFLNGQRGTA